MRLSAIAKALVSRLVRAAESAPPQVTPPRVRADGFEVARRGPVDLGKQPPASTASDAAYVQGLYSELLGRQPDAAGFASHMRGLQAGMSRDEIRNVFLTSPEFRGKQAAAGVEAPSSQAPRAGVPGKLGPVPLEGYDNTKLNDFSHQTVKYQFGRVATNYPLDSVKDKASAQALLEKMRPDLEAAGLKIQDIKGDKILVQTDAGNEWVDVVRGSGSGKPGWWWGSSGDIVPGSAPASKPASSPVGGGPGAELSTVPALPEYRDANLDTSSPEAAARSAADWVKRTYPQLFGKGDDRQVAFQVMTHVVGALRAAGYDATRVVNHPDRAVGEGMRYGSDAVALNGRIFDVYGSFGSPGGSNVQALDVGPYEAGRLRE